MSSMKSVTYSHQWPCLVDFIEKRFPAVSLWIQTSPSFVFQRRAEECEVSEKATSTNISLVDSVPQECKRKGRKEEIPS